MDNKKYTSQEIIEFLRKDMQQDVSAAKGNENDEQSIKFVNEFVRGFCDAIGNNPDMEPGLLCVMITNIMNIISKRYYTNPNVVGRKAKVSEVMTHISNSIKLVNQLNEAMRKEYTESEGRIFVNDLKEYERKENIVAERGRYFTNKLEELTEDEDDDDDDQWRSSIFTKSKTSIH